MFARMWYAGIVSAGMVLSMAGCQSTPSGSPAKRVRPTVAQVAPTEVGELQETASPEIMPDTHLAAGRLHESQGRLARAAEQYRLAIGVRPDDVEAYNRLGVVLDRLGKYKDADEAFARAIQLAPKRAYLHNNLAFSYTMQGRWSEAEGSLNKALQLQPDFPRARVNLGMVQAQQGRFENAFEQFSRVLKPEDAYYNIGLMYQSKKQTIEAAQAFQQALAANPKMTAAQKRLDMLPAMAISEAGKRGELFVQAVALTGTTAADEPATRPAGMFEVADGRAEASTSILPEAAGSPDPTPGEFPDCDGPDSMSPVEEPGWLQRESIPEAAEHQPEEMSNADEETSDIMEAELEMADRLRPHVEQIQALIRGWVGPLQRLLIEHAARQEGALEIGSPHPEVVPEPMPAGRIEVLPMGHLGVIPTVIFEPDPPVYPEPLSDDFVGPPTVLDDE